MAANKGSDKKLQKTYTLEICSKKMDRHSGKEVISMDNDALRQIEHVVNNLQSQIIALKIVTQTYCGLEIYRRPDRVPAMSNWSRNAKDAVDRFESYAGDQAGDEAMKQRMQIFVHDYLDEISSALKEAANRSRDTAG